MEIPDHDSNDHHRTPMEPACLVGKDGSGCGTARYIADYGEDVGRRIYIQEQSFAHLAEQSEVSAALVYGMLARVSVIKAVYHYVQEDGVFWGHISHAQALKIMQVITDDWMPQVITSLQAIGYRPPQNHLQRHFYPVLAAREHISATCYFGNYYTFATGRRAAEDMYADTRSILTIKEIGQHGNDDLVMISGRRLALIDPDVGVGEGKATAYAGVITKRSSSLAAAGISTRQAVYHEVRSALVDLLDAHFTTVSSSEARVRLNVLNAVDVAFSRGVLKTSAPV